jgi:hypothetical protein
MAGRRAVNLVRKQIRFNQPCIAHFSSQIAHCIYAGFFIIQRCRQLVINLFGAFKPCHPFCISFCSPHDSFHSYFFEFKILDATSQIVARQCVTHQTALSPQIAHNASWNANLLWLHAHAHNIRQPKSSSRRWPQIEGWLAFGAGLTRSLGNWDCQILPYASGRKPANLYLVSTNYSHPRNVRFDPQTF